MATSGTVETTTFNTRRLIDRSYRMCKIPPQTVTSEMLQVALDELYLLLSGLANTGVPLWTITEYALPMYQGRQTVPCPVGTVDVLNANLRTVSVLTGTAFSSSGTAANAFDQDLDTACVQLVAAGYIGLQLDSDALLTTIGIMPGATGTWDISLQYSDDDVTYTTFQTYTGFVAVDGEWQWLDFEGLPTKEYWRLKANGTTILDVIELAFCNNASSIPMDRMNKDDYFALPQKSFPGRPVQYWLNRQADLAYMNVWPAPNTAAVFTQQVVILTHRAIEDVGTLRQTIEAPKRWFDAISQRLACNLCKVTPEVKPGVLAEIKPDADEAWRTAWAEERDLSPMTLAPDISPYTA